MAGGARRHHTHGLREAGERKLPHPHPDAWPVHMPQFPHAALHPLFVSVCSLLSMLRTNSTTNIGSISLSPCGLQQPRNHGSFINDNVNLYLCPGLRCTQGSRHCFFQFLTSPHPPGQSRWPHIFPAHSWSYSLRLSTPRPRGHRCL